MILPLLKARLTASRIAGCSRSVPRDMLMILTSDRPAMSTSASLTSLTNFASVLCGVPGAPPRRPVLYGMTTQSKHAPGTPLALSLTAATRPATCEPWSVWDWMSRSLARTEVVR